MGRVFFVVALLLSFDASADCEDEIAKIEDVASVKDALRCIERLNTEAEQKEVDSVPEGTVLAWDPILRKTDGTASGELRKIPLGWKPCNGNNSTINLDKKFLYGTSSLANANVTGGTAIIPDQGVHKHSATTGPAGPSGRLIHCSGNCYGRYVEHKHTVSTSDNGSHDHGGNNLPPNISVVFLCKVND